jgi:cytochrome P450
MREQKFDAHQALAPLALNLICIVLFGHDVLSPGDKQALIGAMRATEDELAEEMFRTSLMTPIAYLSRKWRVRRARATLAYVVNRVRARAGDASILRGLTDLGLSERHICDEVITMLIAGHHTVATAGAWLLYFMATETGLCEDLKAEAAGITDANGEMRPEALKYARTSLAAINEVLRLFPSAWWFSREVKRRVLLGDAPLEPGTCLIISPWQLHRDSRHWPEPHEFRLHREHSGPAYMPFGAGPRVCVGMWLAKLELQIMALEFASTYHIEPVRTPPEPWPKPSVTLIPPSIELSLRLRSSKQFEEVADRSRGSRSLDVEVQG